MKTIKGIAVGTMVAAALISLGGCATRGEDTAAGAGIGAVTGAALTGGSPLGTVGGAAVGGVIGNQIGKDRNQ